MENKILVIVDVQNDFITGCLGNEQTKKVPEKIIELIKENKASVEVLKTDAVWQGITYKEDKEALVNGLKELTDKGEYPAKLWD